MPAPENSHANKRVLPRAVKWAEEHVGKGGKKGQRRFFRVFLDQSRGETVNWDVWGRLSAPYLTRSRAVT